MVKYNDVNPPFQAHLDSVFPEGVSSHGEQYFVKNKPAKSTEGIIELVFEYVRRSHFPKCPSRAQSLFACENAQDAIEMSNRIGSQDSLIWEVTSENAFKGDMTLLTAADSVLVMSYRAHQYWKGLPMGDHPVWEVLLRLPVTVLQRVSIA